MKTFLPLVAFFFFFMNQNISAQNIIQELCLTGPILNFEEVNKLNCSDCGKLIFNSSISDLKFNSQMRRILSEEKDTLILANGEKRFIYKITTLALREQQIIIEGYNIRKYILSVLNLKAGTCFGYFIQTARELIKTGPIIYEQEICSSECGDCGKLIFTTSLSNLKFISNNGYIKGLEFDSLVIDKNKKKYTYRITTLALPDQQVIIKGKCIVDLPIDVKGLEVARCFHYTINPKESSPPPKLGSLSVKTMPPGATLTVNEIRDIIGKTPYKNEQFPVGKYNLNLEMDHYTRVDTSVIVRQNSLTEINLNLQPIPEKTGSLLLNSNPQGALVTINGKLIGLTSYKNEKHPAGRFNINLSKSRFFPVDTSITISPEKLTEINMKLHKMPSNKNFYWFGATVITGGAAGYFKITADKKYQEYLKSTESDEATELQKTVKLYDKLTWAFTGVAAFCAVEFTIQTVKKGKAKNKYQVMLNGLGAQFVANF